MALRNKPWRCRVVARLDHILLIDQYLANPRPTISITRRGSTSSVLRKRKMEAQRKNGGGETKRVYKTFKNTVDVDRDILLG